MTGSQYDQVMDGVSDSHMGGQMVKIYLYVDSKGVPTYDQKDLIAKMLYIL